VSAMKDMRPVTNKKMTPPQILIFTPCQSLLLARRVALAALDPARAIRYHPQTLFSGIRSFVIARFVQPALARCAHYFRGHLVNRLGLGALWCRLCGSPDFFVAALCFGFFGHGCHRGFQSGTMAKGLRGASCDGVGRFASRALSWRRVVCHRTWRALGHFRLDRRDPTDPHRSARAAFVARAHRIFAMAWHCRRLCRHRLGA